jgi:hypothetical protein
MEPSQQEEKQVEIVEIPSHFHTENVTITCRCKVHYLDFEGRSDAKSTRNILKHVAPKRLVFQLTSCSSMDQRKRHLHWVTIAEKSR